MSNLPIYTNKLIFPSPPCVNDVILQLSYYAYASTVHDNIEAFAHAWQ